MGDVGAIVAENIRLLLSMDEPDRQKHASMLADLLGVTQQTGDQLLSEGAANFDKLAEIADAFQVPAPMLLDASLVGTKAVRARYALDRYEYPAIAWIDPVPRSEWKASQLVVRWSDSNWRIASWMAECQEQCNAIVKFVGLPTPFARHDCSVGIYLEGAPDEQALIASKLRGFGYSLIQIENREALARQASLGMPDIFLVEGESYPEIIRDIQSHAKRIIPIVVMMNDVGITDADRSDWGVSYVDRNAVAVLSELRKIVYFRPSRFEREPA